MITLWISTTNQNKLNEFRNILGDSVEIHSVAELKHYSAPPETGKTFVDNARIKAKTLKALRPGTWVVADDSGLEVEGLGGLPGVHSARYAGDKASDGENVAKLLKMMQIRCPGQRQAQLCCVLVAFDPAGTEQVIHGVVHGQIATTARGQTGFGYDPVFIPAGHVPSQEKTYAELGPARKNQTSHRAQAIRELLRLMRA
jgi:XTP/dITP diphosphohydrolase